MPVGTVMEQLLALTDLEIQLLHPAAMFFELLAITPAVSGMVFEVVFEVFVWDQVSEPPVSWTVYRAERLPSVYP